MSAENPLAATPATATEAAPATPQPTPAAAPATKQEAAAPQTVTITVDQYQAHMELARKFAEQQAAQEAAQRKAEETRLKSLAEKGEVEKAFSEYRTSSEKREADWKAKYEAVQQANADKERDSVIASALAGRTFVGDDDATRRRASEMFASHIRGRFSASQDSGGRWSVVETATGRPASEVVPELAAEHKYLFAATNQGGAGGGGGTLAASSQAPPDVLQASVDRYRQAQTELQSFGLHRLN